MHLTSKLGPKRILVVVLVIILIVGSVVAVFIALQTSSSSNQSPETTPTASPTASPIPTATPTSTTTPSNSSTHIVDWSTMASGDTDFWNETASSSYLLTLNNTMADGYDGLNIEAYNDTNLAIQQPIWSITFYNGTFFSYNCGDASAFGYGYCNGSIQIFVNDSAIIITGVNVANPSSPVTGTSPFVINVPFQTLEQIQTSGSGSFNSGDLDITLTIT